MSLFDWLRPQPAHRTRPAIAPEPAPLVLKLEPAPAIQPVPVVLGDATDRAVVALWDDFQRRNTHASWSAFMASLVAANADLDARITKTERYLTDYPPNSKLNRS